MRTSTATLEGGYWEIDLDPAVAARFKRVFDGVDKIGTKVKVSDTPRNAKDLLWFSTRHPVEFDPMFYLLSQAALEDEREEAVLRILSSDYKPSNPRLAFPLRDYQGRAVDLCLANRGILLGDDVGLGKQMPVDTKVLTPSGWRPIGEIRIGEAVIGSSGTPVKVTGVFPQGMKPSYRMWFSDGSSVESGPEHLWTVGYWCGGKKWSEMVVTTEQIRTGATVGRLSLGKTVLQIPLLSGPVVFAPSDPLPIPAYTMGQLLANGSLLDRAVLTTNSADWPEIRARLEQDGMAIGAVRRYGNATRAGILNVRGIVRDLGLNVRSREKRVPPQYMRAAPIERIALLQGLMDGDGSCSATRNKVTFHSTSPGLAEDVRELVEQLGGVGRVHAYDRSHDDKPTDYIVQVRLPLSIAPFSTSRKSARVTADRRAPKRTIERVEYVRDVESVCIRVDAKDSLYVTEHSILTHNTATAIGLFARAEALPAVVVTLTSLTIQWQREVNKFAPELRTHIIKSTKPYPLDRSAKGAALPLPDVMIMSYSKLASRAGGKSWAEVLADEGMCRTVIFDEGQELRNNDSDRYRAARYLREAATFCMMCSVGPDSWVELRGACFGRGWVGPIADAYQLVLAAAAERYGSDGHEILNTADMGIEGRGWTGAAFAWKPVLSFVEHTSHGEASEMRVRGHDLVATNDHSIFVGQQDGSLAEVRTDNVRPKDIVPIDNGTEWGGSIERVIDVPMVIGELSKAQVVVDLSQTSRKVLGVTPWQWKNFHKEAKYGPRLPIKLFLQYRHVLPEPTLVYVGRSKRANTIAPSIRLSEWAYILGFFLGDGWIEGSRVGFSVDTPKVERVVAALRTLPGLLLSPTVDPTEGDASEVRVSHVLFARVLLHAMGKQRCYEKTVPGEWIVSWSEAARRELLRGLLDSDGHRRVRGGWRSVVSSSKVLCRGVLALLRSLGISGSICRRPPRKGGVIKGRQIDGKRGAWAVIWSPHAERGDNTGRRGSRHSLPSDGRFFEGVVRHVKPCPRPDRTYDLEMLGHPSFVADGLLVHNTATPVYNHGGEIHNVVEIVQPGTLGTRIEFLREWCGRGGSTTETVEREGTGEMRKVRVEDPVALGAHLRDCGVFLRRLRAEVGRELPGLQRVIHHVNTDETLRAIDDDIIALCEKLLAGAANQRMQVAGELDWRLRRATGLSKVGDVAGFVRLLVENGQKVLVYGWHRDWYDRLSELLGPKSESDLAPAFYTGTESPQKKDLARARFIGGADLERARKYDHTLTETNVLGMSLRAGAGLDGLQHVCSTVVFGELDWSPGVHEQCLSADTEVLTKDGFRGPDEIDVGTIVCGFDVETGAMTWTPALSKVDRSIAPGEQMFGFRSKKTDIRVTGGHRMVVRRKRRTTNGVGRSEWCFETAASVAGQARRFLPLCGKQEGRGVPLRDCDLRLLGWYVTDGSFNGETLTIYQAAHQPWNADIVETLNACGIKYRLHQRRVASGTLMNMYAIQGDEELLIRPRWTDAQDEVLRTMAANGASWVAIGEALGKSSGSCRKRAKRLRKPQKPWIGNKTGCGWTYLAEYLDKDISPKLDEMTREQLLHFIHGVMMGDGIKSKRLKNVVAITGTNTKMFDRLQSLCVRRGLSARQSVYRDRIRQITDLVQRQNSPARRLWIEDLSEASIPRCDKKNGFREVPTIPGERVWCLTTALGTLVIRRNGRVAVVGNCEGRIYRDGQKLPVVAYYLISDEGSDPVVLDALNLKTEQSEGIRNLSADVAKLKGADPEQMKNLARAFLKKRGRRVPG